MKVRRLNELAVKRGQSLAQMSIAWLLRSDAVTSVIVGASKVPQLEDDVASLKNTSFTPEELRTIDEVLR